MAELETELKRLRAEAGVRKVEVLANLQTASPFDGDSVSDTHCKVRAENGVFATNNTIYCRNYA